MNEPLLLFQALRWVHIVLGAVSLVTFWVVILSKKGGPRHVQVGKGFEWAMYGTSLSALVLCVLVASDPLAVRPLPRGVGAARHVAAQRNLALFLGYLGIVTFAVVRHGVRVLRTRRDPREIQRPHYRAFSLLPLLSGLAMAWMGLRGGGGVLFLAMSPIGIFIGINMLRHSLNPEREHMQWWYEHVGAMIGGGIAAHTAFLVFGASRFLPALPRQLVWLPWVLPTLIGVPAIFLCIAHYRRKFGSG